MSRVFWPRNIGLSSSRCIDEVAESGWSVRESVPRHCLRNIIEEVSNRSSSMKMVIDFSKFASRQIEVLSQIW